MEVKKALNFNVMKIKAVLVSHTHGDHAKYIQEYAKAGIPVFQPYDDYYMKRQYGTFKVFSFALVHDVECYGFWIWHTEIGKLVYASDTEYVRWRFKGVNHILCEANHSIDLADRNSAKYEHQIRGHMSIDTACEFLKANNNPLLMNVVLCHLSGDSSDKDLFLEKANEVVNCNIFVAEKGLEIPLNLYPFQGGDIIANIYGAAKKRGCPKGYKTRIMWDKIIQDLSPNEAEMLQP